MAEDHGHDEHGGGEGGGEDHGKGEHKAHGSHGAPHGGGHEEHAGAPEWLISFADNVALLMGFFVILLAMNMGPKSKATGAEGEGSHGGSTPERERMVELEMGMRRAFHNVPRPDSKNPADQKLLADYNKLHGEDGIKPRNGGAPGKDPEKQTTPNGDMALPNLTVEFDNGTANLSPRSREEIAKLVIRELMGKGWVVEVRGHVSATEARTAERAQLSTSGADQHTDEGSPMGDVTQGSGAGYALSYQRAYVVASEMARNGLPWRHMRLMACSDMQRKVARADDPQGNQRNQRVEIIQSTVKLPDDPLAEEPGRSRN